MKSERRHELQQNSLARGIQNLPNYWRESGAKTALVVIAILLAVFLVRLWRTNSADKKAQVAQNLANAQSLLTEWRNRNWGSIEISSPERFAVQRNKMRDSIEQSVNTVLQESDDPAQQTRATLIRADLYWQLAQFGEPPGAATQPVLKLDQSPSAFLEQASKEYEQVLSKGEAVSPESQAHARLSLAAIAEDRNDWRAAKGQYDALSADTRTPIAMVEEAKMRLNLLEQLQKPMLIGHPMRPETAPAVAPPLPIGPLGPNFTPPATTQPSTNPATSAPTTNASGPVPAPATQPATP